MSAAGKFSASMGPRLISRGDEDRFDREHRETLGFNGAAADQPRRPAAHRSSRSSRQRFNGAAADQPRRPVDSSSVDTRDAVLQWGRG